MSEAEFGNTLEDDVAASVEAANEDGEITSDEISELVDKYVTFLPPDVVSRIGQSLEGKSEGDISQAIQAIAQGNEVPGLPDEVNAAIREEVQAENPDLGDMLDAAQEKKQGPEDQRLQGAPEPKLSKKEIEELFNGLGDPVEGGRRPEGREGPNAIEGEGAKAEEFSIETLVENIREAVDIDPSGRSPSNGEERQHEGPNGEAVSIEGTKAEFLESFMEGLGDAVDIDPSEGPASPLPGSDGQNKGKSAGRE